MTNPFTFEALQAILHRHTDQLSDSRTGHNTQYRIQDAALGAFGIFFTHSPSFLDYQRRLQHTKGHNNAHTLLGVEQIPCDHQVRNLRDPIAPSARDPVCVEIVQDLEQHRTCASFRGLGDQLLVALDGTQYFSSTAMHGPHCLTRQRTHGAPRY